MTGLRIGYLCCMLALCLVPAEGQVFPALHFTQVSALDGLSSDLASCVAEDREGFIWIGTSNGLNRYDGYRIKQYFHDDDDSGSLSGDEVQWIHCDRAGRLWVTTSLGISCFLPAQNRFVNYSVRETGSRHLDHVDDRPELYEDDSGEIWLMPDKQTLYHVRPDMGLEREPFEGYTNLFQDSLGRFWAFRDRFLFRLHPKTKRVAYARDFSDVVSPGHNIIFATTDASGRFWLSCWEGGMWLFDPRKGDLQRISTLPSGAFRQPVSWTHNGKTWMVVPEEDAGLYLVDPVTLRSKRYMDGVPEANSMVGYSFKNAFVDHTGGLWLCSDRGVNRVAPTHALFDVYPIVPGYSKAGYARVGMPFGFAEIDSLYWINIRASGLYMISPEDMRVMQTYSRLIPLADTGINQTSSAYFFYRRGDDVYITTDSGLVTFNKRTRRITPYFPEVSSYAADFRNLLLKDSNTLWIRAWDNGIFVFDIPRKKFIRHYRNGDACAGCLPSHINWLMRTRAGKIFVSADGGILLEYDSARDTFLPHRLALRPGLEDSIPPGNLFGMAENSDGKLWICSRSGVLIYDPVRGVTEHAYTENGQMGETYRICFDAFGNAWVNGYSGIWIFERAGRRWLHLTAQDGLPGGDAEGFMAMDTRGRIICGVQNALIRFNPARTLFPPGNAPVLITEASVRGRNIEFPLNGGAGKQVVLEPGETSFTLDFAVLSYLNASQNQYYYRLEPLMSDYQKNAGGHLNFTGLAPGTYLLRVKGGDKFGNVFPSMDTLAIVVRPHFYQTDWFRFFVVVLALAAVSLVTWRVVKNIRRESDLREKISQTEMMALRAQMNPHFIFNCLNSIDNLIQDDQKEKATTYLAKFARLIRAILENSKKETIPCWKDLEALQLYLEMESLRLDRKFQWSLLVDEGISRGDYKVPPMILQPFVENAIHHGLMNKLDQDKRLRIEARISGGAIRYLVEDNGVGRAKAAEYKRLNKPDHQSMGMAITMDRIHYFNEAGGDGVRITDLYNTDGEPSGTRIEISLHNQN